MDAGTVLSTLLDLRSFVLWYEVRHLLMQTFTSLIFQSVEKGIHAYKSPGERKIWLHYTYICYMCMAKLKPDWIMVFEKNQLAFSLTTSFAWNLTWNIHTSIDVKVLHEKGKNKNKTRKKEEGRTWSDTSCTYLFPSISNKSWHIAS